MADGMNKPAIRFAGFTDAWEQRKFDEVFDCTVPNNTLSRAELSYDEGTVLNVHYGDVLIKYGSVLDVQKDDIPRIPHRCREDFNGALLQDGDVIIADTAEDETTGKACEIGNLQGSAIVSGLPPPASASYAGHKSALFKPQQHSKDNRELPFSNERTATHCQLLQPA